MRISTLFGRTLREAPAEAEQVSHELVLRAGLVRPMQAGSYTLLPLGMRVARKIEAIMHEEMTAVGGQAFRTPVIQPSTIWEQSGRYDAYGPLMLHLSDRSQRPLLVAPTHEEAVAEVARREISSYRQLPVLLYQIHMKYRDELRTKGGLMRMREFTMLDAYSLDADEEGLARAYQLVGEAFERIFSRCEVEFLSVEAGSGEMGGQEAREYMVPSQAGEDMVARCSACNYAANLEIATTGPLLEGSENEPPPRESVATPACPTIADLADFLSIPRSATAKAVFFDTPERGLLFVVLRGDLEVNETKLRAVAGVSELTPADDETIRAAGAVPGYASPVGLKGVTVIADRSVVDAGPLVAGANREGYHLRNVLYGRDWEASRVADVATAREGDPCPRCGKPLQLEKGIEVGHIFKLGTRYAEALQATYLDPEGKGRPVVMGSYGIGVERLMQVIVEQHHDENGLIWPESVAPFRVHLIRLGKSDDVRAAADKLYEELLDVGQEVLYDDREETAGVKFNDADLIGLPLRLLVSQRLLNDGAVELKPRDGEAVRVPRGEIVERLKG